MRKLIFALLLIASYPCPAQDREEMSFSRLFEKIEQSKDSVFKLSHAKITFDPLTDQRFSNSDEVRDSVFIYKAIELEDVILEGRTRITYISFKRPVSLIESGPFEISNSSFAQEFSISNSQNFESYEKGKIGALDYLFSKNNFHNTVEIKFSGKEQGSPSYNAYQIYFENNTVKSDIKKTDFNEGIVEIWGYDITQVSIRNNSIKAQNGGVFINVSGASNNAFIVNNTINSERLFLYKDDEMGEFELRENEIESPVFIGFDQLLPNYIIDWKDLENKLISSTRYFIFHYDNYSDTIFRSNIHSEEFVNRYRNTHRIENEYSFNSETALLGFFRDHYISNHNRTSANGVFVAIKNLETERLAYLYRENPSFKAFFTWKVNQFLKIFSAYGTEPARAIIFSVYVILAFALIYLFFPNHWDSHGKERIKHRFLFFYKYLSLNKGIHDVYLEDQREEIENNQKFLKVLMAHKEEAPKFFFLAAMPLYGWTMSGTRLYSNLLKRIDFLKGAWKETDKKVRPLKSLLVVLIFVIAICYDLFIKILNAIMLSINTFTTLGFGEIPIKGLPRYLAIIQGFIGWFMLTIFSVSLISQLLN